MNFENKVVLVTGAGSGIGAATAILFAKEGANIVAIDVNEERVNDIGTKIESIAKKPLVIKADVSKDDEAEAIIKQTIDKFGRLDVLVNNAGILRFGCISDGKLLEAYDEMVPINLRAVINLTTLAAPHLISSKGNIINLSSAASFSIRGKSYTPYAVTKAAVEHFTRGAALEMAPSGVRVNSVHPGPVWTNIVDRTQVETWNFFKEATALKK